MCPEQDSNLHASQHSHLKRARLPFRHLGFTPQSYDFFGIRKAFCRFFCIFAAKYSSIEFMLNIKSDIPVGLCSDHAGFELKEAIKAFLVQNNIPFVDFGTDSDRSCDYPDFAHPCAVAVEEGRCYPGIAMCGSGNGIAMTLNKHQGIRAAICWNTELAKLARQHNDANVLVLPARFIPSDLALQIVAEFLDTPFEGGRHERRVAKIPL